MSSRHDEPERLGRLAGTGEGSGGGLPLPVLFLAILTEMLDNGPASTEHLTGIAVSALKFKSNNVMTTWGSWETFTDDVLEQMASREIISRGDDDLWQLGDKFRTGVPLVIIPAGKGRKADGATIWPKDEREQLSKAHHAEREALSMVGRMRPVENQRVNAIRQSEPEVGQLYPVLVDQHGRILDGAHRLEANPHWRRHTIRVDSEEMALAVGLWANSGQPLPAKVRARITELIGDLAGTNQIKRDRIKAALLEDANRSDRVIAGLLGVSQPTVGQVRRELEETDKIYQFSRDQGGRPRKDGTPAKPRAETTAREQQVSDLLTRNPQQSNKQIMTTVGLSGNQHRIVERVRERLEAEGVIPAVTAREGSDGTLRRVPQASEATPPTPAATTQAPSEEPVPGEIYEGPYRPQEPQGVRDDALQQILAILRSVSPEDRAWIKAQIADAMKGETS